MKRIVLITLLLAAIQVVSGQNCQTVFETSEAEIARLDSLHPAAVHVDTTLGVFKGREQEFMEAWKNFLTDFGAFLNENDLQWEEPTRCFNRIYFNADGTIDTFLFAFKEGEVSEARQERFRELAYRFAADYKLQLDSNAPGKFAQCGPVVYQ